MITVPNAWTVLKENSSLVSGTAWEHLNNQEGGSGTGETILTREVIGTMDNVLEMTAQLEAPLELSGALNILELYGVIDNIREVEGLIEILNIEGTISCK